MLEQFKCFLNIQDKSQDAFLTYLLQDTLEYFLHYTNLPVLPKGCNQLIIQLALIRYNSTGNEGESSRSEGDISRSFNSFPKHIQLQINQYRKVRWP
ncbi:MAG: phage head-tail connector protein [Cellulosilyticaceae bacterium]